MCYGATVSPRISDPLKSQDKPAHPRFHGFNSDSQILARFLNRAASISPHPEVSGESGESQHIAGRGCAIPRPATAFLRIAFEKRNVRVSGQWPAGHRIEWTAFYSLPASYGDAAFTTEAIRQAEDQFGPGYEWEATIL